MSQPTHTKRPQRRAFTEVVMGWSRLARTGIVFLGSMALALLLLPVVDQLFFSVGGVPVGQSATPSWVVLAICMSMYFSGYALVIGTPGNTPAPSPAQKWYIRVLAATVVLAIVWYTSQILSVLGGG